jgi:hypothetical protein
MFGKFENDVANKWQHPFSFYLIVMGIEKTTYKNVLSIL